MTLPIIVTLEQRPDLEKNVRRLDPDVWPAFMLKNEVAGKYWRNLYTIFPDYQFAICEGFDQVIASGHSIPIHWEREDDEPPDSWEEVLEKGFLDKERRHRPTTLAALSIVVAREHRRKGLSLLVLSAIKSIGAKHGLNELIAPVRPTHKCLYPLTAMDSYVKWQRPDGSPFDPWLRVHWRQGARIVKISPRSITITGSVADWEKWTALHFPESGQYIVPGAQQPVTIDCERDIGQYDDPSVWMRCRITHTKEF
jgi:hypothetical protein